MADPTPDTPAAAEPTRNSRGIVLRVVIWGAVAAIVVLGVLELKARRNYSGTFNAWEDRWKSAGGSEEGFRESDLADLTQGNPARKDLENHDQAFGVDRKILYTWNGLLGDYSIRVSYAPGENPKVINIEQPNPDDDKYSQPTFKQPPIREEEQTDSRYPAPAGGGHTPPPGRSRAPADDARAPADTAPAEGSDEVD